MNDTPNCVNIYFPKNFKIFENVSKCFLYGFSNGSTYATIYVSSKYVDQIGVQANHEQTKHWEAFRILGELVFVKNDEDIKKYTNSKDKKDKINYIYAIYYKNKPIVVKINTQNKIKTSALFILYNTDKYIYNFDTDHVNNLISDAYKREIVYIYSNKNGYRNTEKSCSISNDSKTEYVNNSNLDNIKIKHTNIGHDQLDQCAHTTTDRENKPCCENKIKEKEESTNIPDTANLENEKNDGEKKKIIYYDLSKNNMCENLLIRDVINLINTRYVYIEEVEKLEEDIQANTNEMSSKDSERDENSESNEKDLTDQQHIPITYIWLFFMYIISVINKTIYCILCIPYIFSEKIGSKNKLSIFKLIKEKCLLNSEWYKIFLEIIEKKKKKNFYEYYKYKQILLIRGFSLLLDILGGAILFYMISIQIINLGLIYDKIKIVFETSTLTSILGTLLQKPLGIKLNNNFTSFIGSVVVSILDKWEFFKSLIPFERSSIIRFFSISSLLGLSIFLSLTIDYFRFITVHVTIIYFFFKRIFFIFHSNMYSLYLLFNGKKWNVLKSRVDTNYYTSEEVILGTMLFAILIFLSPTVLILLFVFGIVYFVIKGLIYFLVILKELILYSPIYILLLRSENKYISKGIKMRPYIKANELVDLPQSHYLLLENDKFLFSDKIKLLLAIYFNYPNFK
ncbi:phosphatidylinositol N-acetylglucosaminyltransferase subunit GPI1, putative [Plasmodium chabaudi chabaudi]|uniref:Phosphatidylinositol N-acetylglucosaminyltransferase subunit GPI1, putative n=1 Tax=Plasmodium chabaudi chabaudi TaxID=31271 RepID=A0A4V0K8Q9_PLACU|nr:phosphatidylinositol N-acetylglucosaminyltransferase subunit GPI1, putative [Plasmodium chabaudi chabaudi]VTZ69171.1 phosphatidylinositol N-acetylglucosaminyltransferase subunit GPI1, putative [Plasmodium chabaudi chabaudi]|eukprot:XP_016653974.1 N-acetylglucosamine transferase, putative [Plasmodium chabaudi chabaudi]